LLRLCFLIEYCFGIAKIKKSVDAKVQHEFQESVVGDASLNTNSGENAEKDPGRHKINPHFHK